MSKYNDITSWSISARDNNELVMSRFLKFLFWVLKVIFATLRYFRLWFVHTSEPWNNNIQTSFDMRSSCADCRSRRQKYPDLFRYEIVSEPGNPDCQITFYNFNNLCLFFLIKCILTRTDWFIINNNDNNNNSHTFIFFNNWRVAFSTDILSHGGER